MSFNKGYELKKFEAHWEKLRIEYAAAGMMEDAIQKMYDYEAHPLPRPAAHLGHRCDRQRLGCEIPAGHAGPHHGSDDA